MKQGFWKSDWFVGLIITLFFIMLFQMVTGQLPSRVIRWPR
ncbi:MAG: hypothetical protein RQ936_06460 [Gammaproteobacteria bacterium]|nr:hypothetical protein [Gammaproteobacteria bacterium]